MHFKWLKKLGSALLATTFVFTSQMAFSVVAASDNIEVVLTDVTADDQTTLLGEAKVKVSVKGAGGRVSAVQTSLKFEGGLKYKSIDFLKGENNPPRSVLIPPNAALANSTGNMLPCFITNSDGSITFTDDETDVFILTFAGEPGESVTVSVNNDSAAKSHVQVDGAYINTDDSSESSVTAIASSEDNAGIKAVVKLAMTVVDDFTVSRGDGYADSKIVLTITNERTGSTISTVLNTVSNTKGGHYDSSSSVPTFIVENTVVEGATYTVEIKGSGYKTYKKTGVTFENDLELTNDDFVPGDINLDNEVDSQDKALFEEIKAGSYDERADFNRDGKVDSYDDIFDGIDSPVVKNAPAKMSAPTLKGGKKKITVSWTAPANGGAPITGYTIKYGTNNTNLNQTKEVTDATAVSFDIKDLKADATYYVQIAAKNEIGIGEFSPIANAKTAEEAAEGGG
ncbi:MAG: fibronectin type III domain-containing protein, partial [Clostridia bacterium]|nr:fibronectin type III domain-containing protein [Clostridia bacterium]